MKLHVTSVCVSQCKSINSHPWCQHSWCREVAGTSQGFRTEVSLFSLYDSSRMRLFWFSYHAGDLVPCSQWADFTGLYYWVRLRVATVVCVWVGNKPSVTVTLISRDSLSLSVSHSLCLLSFWVSMSLKGILRKTIQSWYPDIQKSSKWLLTWFSMLVKGKVCRFTHFILTTKTCHSFSINCKLWILKHVLTNSKALTIILYIISGV